MEPNAQPPRIQVALATGKLVLPEQGCLGQGGCEAKPDYEGVEASAYDPVRKLWTTEGELVSSRESLLAIGGNASWNLIMIRCEDQPLNKAVDKEGRE